MPSDPAAPPGPATPSGPGPGVTLDALLASLRRWPDVEGGDLPAADGAERLLLDELAQRPDALDAARSAPGALVTLDDGHGALTLGGAALGAVAPRAWQDSVVAERALDANADHLGVAGSFARPAPSAPGDDLVGAQALAGARVVLLRLPRSLAALTELAESVARHAAPDVVLLAAGMTKHMTRTMNDVLAASFADVHATRGRYKARALVARVPRPAVDRSFPVASSVPGAGGAGGPLVVHAYGPAFAGPRLDRGARFLLDQLGTSWSAGGWSAVRDVVDLGCGTGALATRAALALPGARVVATDVSAAAVASTALTAAGAGVGDRVVELRDDAASALPDASADVVLCNPPFHVGSTLHTGVASRMFRAAARVLRPGGTLWTVYNSPLAYRTELGRTVGPTEQVARNPTFTVTRSVRRG